VVEIGNDKRPGAKWRGASRVFGPGPPSSSRPRATCACAWIDASTCTPDIYLDTARRNPTGYDVEFVKGQIEQLDLRSGGFDRLICTEVLEHTTNPDEVLHAIRNLLANDGRAIITVPIDAIIDVAKQLLRSALAGAAPCLLPLPSSPLAGSGKARRLEFIEDRLAVRSARTLVESSALHDQAAEPSRLAFGQLAGLAVQARA
jgi:SAM-dependent methyltransferase